MENYISILVMINGNEILCILLVYATYLEAVWIPLNPASAFYKFHVFVFFFLFFSAFVDFGWQNLLLWTVYALFTHCAYTVHVLKNIKNGSHGTIYTFKNYFTTVFFVFSFQFSISATISSIQTDPKYESNIIRKY